MLTRIMMMAANNSGAFNICMMAHYLIHVVIMIIHILKKGKLSFTQLGCAELGFKLKPPDSSSQLIFILLHLRVQIKCRVLQYAFPDSSSHDFSLPTLFFFGKNLITSLSFKLLNSSDFSFTFQFLSAYCVNRFSVNV